MSDRYIVPRRLDVCPRHSVLFLHSEHCRNAQRRRPIMTRWLGGKGLEYRASARLGTSSRTSQGASAEPADEVKEWQLSGQ